MLDPAGYQIQSFLHESGASRVFRATRTADDTPVVLKLLKHDIAGASERMRYQRESDLLGALELDGVPELLALEQLDGAPMLVLRDTGADALAWRRGDWPLAVAEVLDIAIGLVKILAGLHRHDVLHKDINPTNIIYDPQRGVLEIIDFGCSSRRSRESVSALSPHSLAGTLAYMSPEQTGRTNRAIDVRTDFYSLGVTLYELLTGTVPFTSRDPLALVHCHLAREPAPVTACNPEVPQVVSDLVMKLMAKAPEDRYQSARGCLSDLERCRGELAARGEIAPFALGERDLCERFQIQSRLYGREREREALLEGFERVATGGRELMLIAGYAGIGKSVLVRELYGAVLARRGYFIAGKFDQYRRNLPYSALASAFGALMEQLLAEPEPALQAWRAALGASLGQSGQVLIDVIPELEFVIGPQPPVPELGSSESENRFNRLFRRFLAVFCTAEHPLALFVDDLQWADAASLRLLRRMLADRDAGYLFVVGAYRDNEVGGDHLLAVLLEQLEADGVSVQRVALRPLRREHIEQLIHDACGGALTCSADGLSALAELVLSKTDGNLFFVNQFLQTLEQGGLFRFDADAPGWRWELAEVRTHATMDNVVELMVERISQLPAEARRGLQMAACVGNRFDIGTLAIICELSQAEVHQHLQPALAMGLIEPLSEMVVDGGGDDGPAVIIERYAFLHDRVQQAAYALISETERAAVRLRIGRLLLRELADDERERRIFELAEHFAHGAALIDSVDERLAIARLDLAAGRRAQSALAREVGLGFLRAGLALLPEDAWQSHYQLKRDLCLSTIEVEYQHGDVAAAAALAEEVLDNARALLDKIEVYEYRILFHIARNEMNEAIEVALDALPMLGISLPRGVAAMAAYEREIRAEIVPDDALFEALEAAPELTEPTRAAALRILTNATSAAYIANPAVWRLMVLTAVVECVHHGNSALAVSAYSWYGALLCGVYDDHEAGYRFGSLSLSLLDRFSARSFEAKVLSMLYVFVMPWSRPLSAAIDPLRRALQSGLQYGDHEYALYAAVHCTSYRLLMGDELDEVAREQSTYFESITRYQLVFHRDFSAIWAQTCDNLRGPAEDPTRLVGQLLDEGRALPRWEQQNIVFLLFCAYCCKAMLAVTFGDAEAALAAAERGRRYLYGVAGTVYFTEHNLYWSLALLAVAAERPADEAAPMLNQVAKNQAQRASWRARAPANFELGYQLIEAERAALSGDVLAAMKRYQDAILAAREQHNARLEALICERAAGLYHRLGHRLVGDGLLQQAYRAYQRWGAYGKVAALEAAYPWLLGERRQTREGLSTSSLSPSDSPQVLDLASVVKATQAISSQLVIDELLATLMKIIIENAGAERGYLLLMDDGELTVEAEGSVEHGRYRALPSLRPESGEVALATHCVNYVLRRRQGLVLRDARSSERYGADPYIASARPRSLLCAPIELQGALIGVVYLENNHIEEAFTAGRVEVVQMLAAQAAISIANARLLSDLEHSRDEAERANQAKSRFLASVNHELRTPMNAIIGMVELLLRTGHDAEQRGYLATVQAAADHLMGIIRETLDLSRIEAGQLELASAQFSLSSCVDDVTRLMSLRVDSQGLSFERRVAPDVPDALVGDRDRLQQILVNLVGNAIKFTAPGGTISLAISAETLTDERVRLRLGVRDTGIGIPVAAQQAIFEPFYQHRERAPGISDSRDGAGLGLAISSKLAELMGGSLSVTSAPGRGSEFVLTADFGRGQLEPAEADAAADVALGVALGAWPAGAAAASADPRPPGRSLRLLVAEDNQVNQLVLSRLLQLDGHHCTVVGDGERAVETWESGSFDAVLMDVQMPVMDGRAAAREIRRREREAEVTRPVPIVAVTAYSTAEERTACVDAGIHHFLSKPVRLAVLRELLTSLTRGSGDAGA
ncbi:MAG: AAA family ATPase [Haliangiales bacterium]